MKAFVTGGTGFIGASIVRELLRDGYEVRALARPGSDRRNLDGLDVEIWEGDLSDRGSLIQGLAGCQTLFHAAADYRLWTRSPASMYEVNVGGTRTVLAAALAAGVEKVVYTSSVGTLGNPGDGAPGNEATPVDFSQMVGDYKKSKFLAERAAQEFLAKVYDKAIHPLASLFAGLVPDVALRERVFGMVTEEFQRARRHLLAITGQKELLEQNPSLARSIKLRNPYVDPLSMIQIELLRRRRGDKIGGELDFVLAATINGIASGLRNTG